MSVIEQFEINLEHDIDEQYQYEPGEQLRGNVLLVVNAPIKVKAIAVQIKGEATVSWEDEGVKNSPTYRADETYIDITQNLLQARSGDSLSLGKGRHKFPLEYLLPYNLPSSFIGKFGSITYVVKATLKEDKKFGLSTMITSEPFLVLRRLDLSREDYLLKPKESHAEKRLWGALAFCISGKVSADLTVNKVGHLPGEDIFMDAEITNDSPRVVKAVQASIIMHSTFSAKNNTRYNTQVVNKKRDEWEMSYGEGRRWKNVRITIPPYIPESRLDGCDIIDIRYELMFKLEISGGNELKIVIPITVGTVQGGETFDAKSGGRVYRSGMPNADQYIMAPEKTATPSPVDRTSGEYMNGDANGMDVNGVNGDHIDIDMNDEEAEKFRYPMAPGETRKNPIFNNK